MQERIVPVFGIRFSITDEHDPKKELGRAYLYLLRNDLHPDRPFGFLEDVFIAENNRSGGLGNKLLRAVIDRARYEGCYKLLAASRNDGTRESVHEWYLRSGFRAHGTEFRMDL